MSTGLQLLLGFFLVLLNGFFVGAEFALVRVRSTRLTELANEGKGAARMALHCVRHFDVYLSATQLGITIASLALGSISEPAVSALLAPGFQALHHIGLNIAAPVEHILSFVLSLSLVSVFHMVIGELVPKSWAIQRSEVLAMGFAYPLHWFYSLFRPAIFIVNAIARVVLRLLHLSPTGGHELAHSEEELRMILTASGEHGILKDSEVDLVKQVFEFADKVASDVMVPRVDMVYMDATWPLEKNLEVAHNHTFTRFPLCEGDPDHVIGMIHIRDLLSWAYAGANGRPAAGTGPKADGKPPRTPGESLNIRSIRWDILFVPETKSIDQLLREFQLRKMHMAVVVDEYGGTAGILTIEDVLEQIVGEIYDENEEPRPEVQPQGPDEFLVDGRVLLVDLRADYEIEIPPNGSETIGGWLLDKLGAIPRPGDIVETEGYSLQVQEMDGQRIRKVLIVRHPAPEPAETTV